jgi:hypothetical protein
MDALPPASRGRPGDGSDVKSAADLRQAAALQRSWTVVVDNLRQRGTPP